MDLAPDRARGRALSLPPANPERPLRPCIVHLVRASNGLAPYRAFLDAITTATPGGDWDLVLVMKGFDDEGAAAPYADLACQLSPELLFFGDDGLDLTVYFAAAARLRRDRYCFLNSFSRPLTEGWLAHLDAALMTAGVGIVGASGSWASSFSRQAHLLYLPSAYRGVFPPRNAALEQFLAIDREVAEAEPGDGEETLSGVLARKLRTLVRLPGEMLPFERFPAAHVRTNAFMVSHATLARLRLRPVHEKRDAYLLEHGRRSLTRQVQGLGLGALVVARDGATYEPERWDRSRTFWQGDQEGLLVADNQTRRYADGNAERRRLLSGFAWGRKADPTLPAARAAEAIR